MKNMDIAYAYMAQKVNIDEAGGVTSSEKQSDAQIAFQRNGMYCNRAAGKAKEVTDPEGRVFSSVVEMCNFYGVRKSLYESRMEAGWSQKDALNANIADWSEGKVEVPAWIVAFQELRAQYATYNCHGQLQV